jgi:hypothetical protein
MTNDVKDRRRHLTQTMYMEYGRYRKGHQKSDRAQEMYFTELW